MLKMVVLLNILTLNCDSFLFLWWIESSGFFHILCDVLDALLFKSSGAVGVSQKKKKKKTTFLRKKEKKRKVREN